MKARTITKFTTSLCIAAGSLAVGTSDAQANATISLSGNAFAARAAGDVFLGINTLGNLNVPDSGEIVGLWREPDGDATSPGCECEGWGVSATIGGFGVSGFANDSVGTANLTSGSFVSTATTAISSVSLTSVPGLKVTQDYHPSTNAPRVLFEDTVTIANDTGNTIDDVRYVRVMDWDVPPTEFSEFVTIRGTASTTDLEKSNDNGFRTANPLAIDGGAGFGATDSGTLITNDVDFVDNGPRDHGAYFRFNFGSLDDGESKTFNVYYGAAPNETTALDAIAAEGIELFSLGQSNLSGKPNNDATTFIFGFEGVGGKPVIPPDGAIPEPITATLGGLGIAALASATSRRRKD